VSNRGNQGSAPAATEVRSAARPPRVLGRTGRWAAAGALAAATVAASVAAAQPAAAYTVLGGVSVQSYCRYNDGSSFNAVIVAPGNAYSWRCYNGSQTWYGVTMNTACHQQYSPSANAIALNGSDPYSWRCVTG
jgi:hypothetical protein